MRIRLFLQTNQRQYIFPFTHVVYACLIKSSLIVCNLIMHWILRSEVNKYDIYNNLNSIFNISKKCYIRIHVFS